MLDRRGGFHSKRPIAPLTMKLLKIIFIENLQRAFTAATHSYTVSYSFTTKENPQKHLYSLLAHTPARGRLHEHGDSISVQ